ncbi:pentapeptide repeat-containing protein [Micromonospora sp. RL09-050-HVF-A]|uniref:pentapeptide repeat-containing protein n=1 Tax=Micromonospora sp. RL09-050-HVF-A TaxID=1703433 RepID=UPI001C5EFEBD|nr:pentapeptide repeat-containing protein [Micromonospora sp. RL09-050-HVF-A]MBW4703465.1 pentapeptide repeat-containing protein [Micromonospora sp. RL09-050-HVF-A]
MAVGSILSVLFVAIGLYLTNEANREQQRLTAQGQITDRFSKAIEQLGQAGAEKIDVRLGAIYALERIMRDSAADQPAVVDILATFVRVHAPATAVPTPSRSPRGSLARSNPPVDIQAALTVLGRRDSARDGTVGAGDEDPSPRRLNLSGADLSGADLSGADLLRANLKGSHLLGADLSNANLANANLGEADLKGADLGHANVRDAVLLRADLDGAILEHADLRGAYLGGANLGGAHLIRADLSGANLFGADLRGTGLRNARLGCARTNDDTRLPAGVVRPKSCS